MNRQQVLWKAMTRNHIEPGYVRKRISDGFCAHHLPLLVDQMANLHLFPYSSAMATLKHLHSCVVLLTRVKSSTYFIKYLRSNSELASSKRHFTAAWGFYLSSLPQIDAHPPGSFTEEAVTLLLELFVILSKEDRPPSVGADVTRTLIPVIKRWGQDGIIPYMLMAMCVEWLSHTPRSPEGTATVRRELLRSYQWS